MKKKIKLWQFFDRKSKWTKGFIARDKTGRPAVQSSDPKAVVWCALGACFKLGIPARDIEWKLKVPDITKWNDDPKLTFRKFRAALKKADV